MNTIKDAQSPTNKKMTNKKTQANNNMTKTTKIDSTCEQCKKDDDLMVAFTDHKVCGKCTKKNHKRATTTN